MAAVAVVLAGVWVVASYGERLAPIPQKPTPVSRRVGTASMVFGVITMAYASLVLTVDGDAGRAIWHGVFAAVLLVCGRSMR